MKKTIRMAVISALMTVIVLTGLVGPSFAMAAPAGIEEWSFGVISDTQWTVADDGYNPNTVAANIIKQIDQQFIDAGVDLVVSVGDTVNVGSKVNIDTRALYAQDLYNADVAFYPLRGNHEASEDPDYKDSAAEFQYAFPQIGTGVNNDTPADITTAIIPPADLANNPPDVKTGDTFTLGTNFSEPTDVNNANHSLSYSFEYNNATFVLLDQFDLNGDYYPSTISQQQGWIDGVLSNRPDDTQAFVFAHKNILGGNHKDNMFGGPVTSSDPGDGYGIDTSSLSADDLAALYAKQNAEDDFFASMEANNVPLVISGHDHHHYYSLITSPDGQSQVHQLITQSDSSKFYTPKYPASANDIPIQQDLGRIGYYIFTVDGPQVTIDYYADDSGIGYGHNDDPFHFVKVSTIIYSLNGNEEIVAQGGSYEMTDNTLVAASTEDGFDGTMMSVLSGTNSDITTTNYGKPESKEITTTWMPLQSKFNSDILTLSGLSDLPGEETDTYTLSMSYANGKTMHLGNGGFGIVAQDTDGEWVNAVDLNAGGTTRFVVGSWKPIYGLGTYGVDPAAKTAWAVINYDGTFAVATDSQ